MSDTTEAIIKLPKFFSPPQVMVIIDNANDKAIGLVMMFEDGRKELYDGDGKKLQEISDKMTLKEIKDLLINYKTRGMIS